MRTRVRTAAGVAAVATVALLATACTSTPTAAPASARPQPGWVGFVEQQREAAGEETDAEREDEAASGREADSGEDGEHPRQKVGDSGGESAELRGRLAEFSQARLAPYGSVDAGAYGAAWSALTAQPTTKAAWTEVTNRAYNADDERYRDPLYSNSSGGSGFVAGRVTGLAVDAAGNVYAGGADGGVFRSLDAGATWTSISDSLPTLSTGDLKYDTKTDTLWLATGEANTGATSYVGTGVYALVHPSVGRYTSASRVGGAELESRGINKLQFDGAGSVYAATTRGLWKHSTTLDTTAWVNVLMPDPAADLDITKPYNNIVNDVAIQPGTRGARVIANAAWRNGAAYNGFYLSTDGGRSFALINPTGAIQQNDVGNAEFAYSADGSTLYAVIESPRLLQTGVQSGNTVLKGVYVSNKGDVAGPWNLVADYRKLANSGSALKPAESGKGYAPGVQAWYNNFIAVDPGNAGHVVLGLEEVFETANGGTSWSTIGPYWNFGFACWNPLLPNGSTADGSTIAGCPQTTHSDQHAVAVDAARNRLWVGNDGGVYSRPLNGGKVDSLGHAADWVSANKNLRTLQYYSVATGKQGRSGWSVSGGLQDNGGSLLLPGEATMVSPFGGDGGAVVVDPADGCKILDEYVDLTLWMTTNCGRSTGAPDDHAITDVSVPDVAARFIAPVERDSVTGDWIAGGRSVWLNTKQWTSTGSADWKPQLNLLSTAVPPTGATKVTEALTTAIASRNGATYVAWCGNVDLKAANCNSAGFTRGVATNVGGAWRQLDTSALPNRYPAGIAVDALDDHVVYVAFNGFNRRWIEGPGISGAVPGVDGHVFKGVIAADGTVSWKDITGTLPDVPASAIVSLRGKLVVGTDLGVEVSSDGGATWKVVGPTPGTTGAFPAVTVMYLHVSGDGNLYVATHGRGLWRTPVSSL